MYEARQNKVARRLIEGKSSKQLKPFIDNRNKIQTNRFISAIIQRASLEKWINGARKDKEAPITLYTHILNDGFGDAGQLGYLVDKMKSLGLGRNIIPYATYKSTENFLKLKELSRIENNEYLFMGEDKAGWINECGTSWEIQYPVPTNNDAKKRNNDRILRIHEMGTSVRYILHNLLNIEHTGVKDGIGYGIPTPPEYETNDKTLIDNKIKFEKDKIWLVKLHPSSNENDIKDKAKSGGCECLILLCNGEGDITCDNENTMKVYHIYQIQQNELSYLMSKIGEEGRIYAGGEGMFVQALGVSKAPVGIITRGSEYKYQLEQIKKDIKRGFEIKVEDPTTMLDMSHEQLKTLSKNLRKNNWFDKLDSLKNDTQDLSMNDNEDSPLVGSSGADSLLLGGL